VGQARSLRGALSPANTPGRIGARQSERFVREHSSCRYGQCGCSAAGSPAFASSEEATPEVKALALRLIAEEIVRTSDSSRTLRPQGPAIASPPAMREVYHEQ